MKRFRLSDVGMQIRGAGLTSTSRLSRVFGVAKAGKQPVYNLHLG